MWTLRRLIKTFLSNEHEEIYTILEVCLLQKKQYVSILLFDQIYIGLSFKTLENLSMRYWVLVFLEKLNEQLSNSFLYCFIFARSFLLVQRLI